MRKKTTIPKAGNNEKANTLPIGVTQLQINHWKNQYGEDNVKVITIPLDDKGQKNAVGYFRKPDMNVMMAAGSIIDSNPLKAGLVFVDNCFLGGDPDFKTNDEVRVSAINLLNKWFKIRVGTIKNA
jgi:hypothetical protein